MQFFPTPQTDLATFTDHLSQAWGVAWSYPAAQYIAWSHQVGLFSLLQRAASFRDICRATALTEDGADALIPILMALDLVKEQHGCYALTTLASEYFLPSSPYYVGAGLYRNCDAPFPQTYVRAGSKDLPRTDTVPSIRYADTYFKSQLSRNLAAGVVAVRSGRFAGISHLVDIGGGAGSMVIPFARDYPLARVTLVDLPQGIDIISGLIASEPCAEQLHLVGMDVFLDPWAFGSPDAILFGNFFHMFSDSQCQFLSQQSFDTLPNGGRVFLHEIPFEDDRSGPLVAALWNANMRVIGGRQRTSAELITMLQDAGFSGFRSSPTASRFQLIEGIKR